MISTHAPLETLTLDQCYNQPLAPLPTTLLNLTIPNTFNYELDIPASIHVDWLQELYLGIECNLPLTTLPSSLQILEFHINSNFNKYITIPKPSQLQTLLFGNAAHDRAIDGSLPVTLQTLRIRADYSDAIWFDPRPHPTNQNISMELQRLNKDSVQLQFPSDDSINGVLILPYIHDPFIALMPL